MMASHHHHSIGSVSALPLAAALAFIPSLPRPVLARLVERAIERLDELEGDPDLEDSEAASTFVDERGRLLPGDWSWLRTEDDENEHDAEVETLSHPDDHPAELFRGARG